MKLEWDELDILSAFVNDHETLFIETVERFGFESQIATAIRARLAKVAKDAHEDYMARSGKPARPATRKCTLQCSRMVKVTIPDENKFDHPEEIVYDVQLQFNPMDGWYWTGVPGHLSFLLLTRAIPKMQQMLEDRGWKWRYVGEDHP